MRTDGRSSERHALGRGSRLQLMTALVVAVGCAEEMPRGEPEAVFALSPPTWFEDGFSYYDVSPDGTRALYGARFGIRLIDLARGVEDSAAPGVSARTAAATFDPRGRLARSAGTEAGWLMESDSAWAVLAVPADAVPRWSRDGSKLAWYGSGSAVVRFAMAGAMDSVRLDGQVTGLAWAPDGESAYALVFHDDGTSSLERVAAGSAPQTVRAGLDAPSRFNSIAVARNGRTAFLSLASDTTPDNEARHLFDADRDTDIYALDLRTGGLTAVVGSPGDDFYPVIAGDFLYWTRNDMRDAVVVVPLEGGDARVVQEDAQIPYWRPDGRQIGVTMGGWRIADWALNLDAFAVNVDSSAYAISTPLSLVVGYHEDFTPAWSPDGQWLAYHSHRAPAPVPAYASAGSTDDIYLRRVGTRTEQELRLTDFGWEVGMADWSRDSRRLVFDSWERGRPGIAVPWIATIDPATGRLLQTRRLALPPDVAGTLLATWSPVADEIALVGTAADGSQSLWVVRPDGSNALKLVDFRSTTYGGLDWTADGRALVYGAIGDNGRMQIFSVPRRGGSPRQLTRDADGLLHPQVSPDNRWIAATRTIRGKALHRIRLR